MNGQRQHHISPLSRLTLLLLLILTGSIPSWAGVHFEAVNRMTDNGDGTYTSANNAGNQYALAIADFSEIAGIITASTVTVEFDCNIPSDSRWQIGFGDKSTRGTNANGSNKSSYNTDGLIMRFGTSDGTSYRTNGDANNASAFNQTVHVSLTFNRSSNNYSYSIVNKETPSTVYFSGNDIATTVSNLTIIEVYTWQSNATITLSDVKVFDGFYFSKGTDVMYIEDMVYHSPLVNETGNTATYTITGNDGYFRTETDTSPYYPFYPRKTSGSDADDISEGSAVTIAASTGSHSSEYNLRIKTRNEIAASSLVTGEVFEVGNTVGKITDESVAVGDALTLHFGNASELQVIRNDGNKAVACIDYNGYTFTHWPDWDKDKEPDMGTFFKIVVTEARTLVVNGYFSAITDEQVLLRKANGDGTLADAVMSIANPGDGSLAMGKVRLTETGTYYLCSQTGTFSLKSLIYTNIQVTLTYANSIHGVAFFGETLSAPTFVVTDLATNTDLTSHYSLTSSSFVSSNTSAATVDSSTGVVTTSSTTQGTTVITCNLTSDTPATYPNLSGVSTTLYVTDGLWDIENETTYDRLGNLNNSQWNLRGSTHVRAKTYTDTDYEYLWNNSGDLWDVTYGLQIKGNSRFYSNGNTTPNAYVNLFSRPTPKATLRIPAHKGMTVEIKSFASDDETELTIEGVSDFEGNNISSYTMATSSTTKTFLCNSDDGYVTLYNNNYSLYFNIQKITVSSAIVLRDGNDSETIYVEKGTGYQNEIINSEGSTFTYSITSGSEHVTQAGDFSTSGQLTSLNSYGTVTIQVTGSGGRLNGKTKTFTLEIIDLGIFHVYSRFMLNNGAIDIGEYSFGNDLKTNVTVTDGSGTNTTLQGQVEFSVVSCSKSSTTASVTMSGGNYVFSANGLGDVVLKAKLGTIEKTFTCSILGVEFSVMKPVITNDLTSYDLIVQNTDGTINSVSSPTITAVYGNLSTPTVTVNADGKTLNITNINANESWNDSTEPNDARIPSSKGGAFIVSATVNYRPIVGEAVNVTLSTLVTVAYSQHIWNFQYTDLTSTLPTYNETGNILGTRPLPTNKEDYYVATDASGTWQYQKKFRSPDSNGGYVYAYLKTVDGNNATVIQPSAGLLIYAQGTMGVSSYAAYTDNGFENNESKTDHDTYWEYPEGYKYSKTDEKREIVFKSGCRIVIPKVKPGQQIDCYWRRHNSDQGERLRMSGLGDATGEEITDIYKIAFTGVSHNDTSSDGYGSYSFIVAGEGDDPVDVEIWSVDGTWTRLYEIVLWEKPADNYSDTQSTYASTMKDLSSSHYLHVDNDESFTLDLNDDVREQLFVHNGGNPTYTIKQDATLNASIDMSSGHPVFTYTNGWGKLYVALSNCTQDGKYISTWRNYTITVGKKPEQTYPHTWDFTKYMNNTKTNIASSDRVEENVVIQVREDKVKTVSRATQTWNVNSNDYAVITTHYGESSYESYHVDGAQLVSSALNAPLPETEGLGFNLNNGTAGLTLSMDNTTANSGEQAQKVGDNYQTWKSSGKLSIGSGGKVIVPKPNDDTNYGNYYIYVNSSVEPSEVTNAEEVTTAYATDNSLTFDVNNSNHQYRYRFTANANAEFTFGSDAEIYAIAVTDEFKQMTKLGTGWATESRDRAIDYTLNSLLTTNPVKAYAIIEKSGNPLYSDDKTKTTVAINDERYVVPANQGLVLKQVTGVPDIAEKATYQVPLFVPAVTTASDAAYQFENNLMRPCVEGKTFTAETENLDGTTGTDYTVFILTNRYMTWKKEGSNAATYDEHFTSGNVAAFYRMHLYGNDSYDGGTARNTLGVNKAYLLLRTDKINAPIWNTSSPAPAPQYIGIAGVSDMDEAVSQTEEQQGDGRTYNLRGQAVDGSKALPAGIYIRNGRKIIIR